MSAPVNLALMGQPVQTVSMLSIANVPEDGLGLDARMVS